ncbi:MAG: aldo/keto reductase [Desulfobacterales bacterium]
MKKKPISNPVDPDSRSWTRRRFLKTAGAVALGSAMAGHARPAAATSLTAAQTDDPATVPQRPFGKTGQMVSILSLGGMFDIPNNQLLLKQAVKWGVTYWDTANSYEGGRSEKGIGKYFEKYPEDRQKIFLVTKTGAWTTGGMTEHLDTSLERMQTDVIDLFFVHGIRSIDKMDGDIKAWGEKSKAAGKIRFFGFSTHSNMEDCLLGAAKLDWIDGIMFSYNYRLMQSDRMQAAVEACTRAGIGLTAMKTQGGGSVRTETETELKLAGRFLEKGFTDGQAKLKAVWENRQIASICSQMPNLTLLMSNVSAALDKTRLGSKETGLLRRYAHETQSDYCAGCTALCEPAVAHQPPIGDIMRCLMYSRSYANRDLAREVFRGLPHEARTRLAALDYTAAESRCPRKIAIGRLVRQAVRELS